VDVLNATEHALRAYMAEGKLPPLPTNPAAGA
jgi:hypothetical protein